MIIDSLPYTAACSCGKKHSMTTLFSVIESDCLKKLRSYMDQYALDGFSVAVYDTNTYRATADRHPAVDQEIILDAQNLHANEHGVAALAEKLDGRARVLIAIGSGTVHDITRYCAYERGCEFVSCPTAASVDGFCSSVAAMTWKGCKKTLTAVAPKIVVADIEIIKHAPLRLTRSGIGDMVGKYIALTDWKIGQMLTNEYYCSRIADMMWQATQTVLRSAQGIKLGQTDAYKYLMYGLLLSGLAMQMIGHSRPASGAEHHISHLIEMKPQGLPLQSDALHGEKVGVGTLLALAEYQRLSALPNPQFTDYTPFPDARIEAVFGPLAQEIKKENQTDAAAGITRALLEEHWHGICQVVQKLPAVEELESLYHELSICSTLSDIGVSPLQAHALLDNSPMVRNRLTLMRLRRCIL